MVGSHLILTNEASKSGNTPPLLFGPIAAEGSPPVFGGKTDAQHGGDNVLFLGRHLGESRCCILWLEHRLENGNIVFAIQLLKTYENSTPLSPCRHFLSIPSNGRSLDQLQTPSLELKNLQNLKPCPTGELQHLRSGKAGKTSKEARGNWMQPRFPT